MTWGRGEWRLIIFCDRLKPFLKSPNLLFLPLSSSPKIPTDRVYRISWKQLTSGRTPCAPTQIIGDRIYRINWKPLIFGCIQIIGDRVYRIKLK